MAGKVQLSERLTAIAEMVTEGNRLVDVGCDHGYLPVYLMLQHKIPGAIATDVGNCRELIYGNNDGFGEAGILTHIMNIEEIAHAMVTMSVNEKDRRRMGEAGYRRVNAFYRIDQMKEVYREIYKGFSDRQNLSWTEEPFQISVYEKMM